MADQDKSKDWEWPNQVRPAAKLQSIRPHVISLPETLSLCNEWKVFLKVPEDAFSRLLRGLGLCDCVLHSKVGGYERQPPKLMVTDKEGLQLRGQVGSGLLFHVDNHDLFRFALIRAGSSQWEYLMFLCQSKRYWAVSF